jgi:hypothetical protein
MIVIYTATHHKTYYYLLSFYGGAVGLLVGEGGLVAVG